MGFSSFTVLKCCFIFIFPSVSCRLGGSSSLVLRKREEAQALGSPSHSVLCLGTYAAGPDDSFLWAPHCIMGCQAAPLFFHQMPVAPPARQPKLSPDFTKCLLRGRVTPVESTSLEGRGARGAWQEGRSLQGLWPPCPRCFTAGHLGLSCYITSSSPHCTCRLSSPCPISSILKQ